MRQILLILFLLPLMAATQPAVNHTDANGLKQGPWQKKYPNGKLMYQGHFTNGKPTGEWKRWLDTGSLKAILLYSETSDSVKARLYEGMSNPVAEGTYFGEKKTGTWTYFSKGSVIAREEFSAGLKNGTCRKYYPSGEILEESQWENDQLHGTYRALFTSGKPFLECTYKNGKRDGTLTGYYPSGAIEVRSLYRNDLPDGPWTFFGEKGDTLYILHYSAGKLQNPEVLDSLDTKKLEELEKQRDRLVDPEKYLEDPEGFLERKR